MADEKEYLSEEEEILEDSKPDSTDIFEENEVKWKEFRLEKCQKCGKTPTIHKNFDFTDYRRYQIHCCGIDSCGYSKTACIVEWNWKQDNLSKLTAK